MTTTGVWQHSVPVWRTPIVTTGFRWLLVLVAILWSTSGLFAKAPWLAAWPVEVRGPLLAFWRTLFAGLFLLPLVRQPRWTWRLLPSTLIFAAMNVTKKKVRPAQPPGDDETEQVGEAIPAHLERPQGDGDRIDIRVGEHGA